MLTIISAYHTCKIRIQDNNLSTVSSKQLDKVKEREGLKINVEKQMTLDLTVFINEPNVKHNEFF